MPDKDKPVTAQEAVEAMRTLSKFCCMYSCDDCPLNENDVCDEAFHTAPQHWELPDIKEARDA